MPRKKTTRELNKPPELEVSLANKDMAAGTENACEAAGNPQPAKDSAQEKSKKPDMTAGPTPEFSTAKEFAKALAEKRNLVEVGSELLGPKEVKGASVRARVFETTLEYLYGKPVAAAPPDPLPVRVVWDIAMPSEEPPE
jgi:hypothetical protein